MVVLVDAHTLSDYAFRAAKGAELPVTVTVRVYQHHIDFSLGTSKPA